MGKLSRITLALLLTEGRFSCVKASQSLGLFSNTPVRQEDDQQAINARPAVIPNEGDIDFDPEHLPTRPPSQQNLQALPGQNDEFADRLHNLLANQRPLTTPERQRELDNAYPTPP